MYILTTRCEFTVGRFIQECRQQGSQYWLLEATGSSWAIHWAAQSTGTGQYKSMNNNNNNNKSANLWCIVAWQSHYKGAIMYQCQCPACRCQAVQLNKWVLRPDLNNCSDWRFLIFSGSRFHASGADMVKERSPKSVSVRTMLTTQLVTRQNSQITVM